MGCVLFSGKEAQERGTPKKVSMYFRVTCTVSWWENKEKTGSEELRELGYVTSSSYDIHGHERYVFQYYI